MTFITFFRVLMSSLCFRSAIFCLLKEAAQVPSGSEYRTSEVEAGIWEFKVILSFVSSIRKPFAT